MICLKIIVSFIAAIGVLALFSGAIEDDRGVLIILVPVIGVICWIILKGKTKCVKR